MANVVGSKGQVVIKKEIRDQLGIEPGWRTVQLVVDDHVELYFIPPEHNRSLAGSLAQYTNVRIPDEDELHDAIEEAWAEMARERVARWQEDSNG